MHQFGMDQGPIRQPAAARRQTPHGAAARARGPRGMGAAFLRSSLALALAGAAGLPLATLPAPPAPRRRPTRATASICPPNR
ncbi:hypothetical protein I6I07_20680 [Achromobacter deleyi]|uniref:Uncharacterized protein n=1 Tax=Achromobacter deleyi TaxID=1353891 RepID=A0A7T4AZW8_9BURK|nr:hypothetical protein [Achromobacter deleyi]QQB33054.1 hypothetical protein I6I07_20680 [Achromobacter deleyi]